ncbi:hypothetical protein [Desmospora profundinema]|uniref:Uncharacterized protein n=1 Tax=Desmospora profundinema TaxID=1571184 RepID=A0ABU1IKW6_9BACL|nr:hypothetical protein [Desmospora profundinema]MDR6225420.1 hypothetical protein [Desmospora profundinema]
MNGKLNKIVSLTLIITLFTAMAVPKGTFAEATSVEIPPKILFGEVDENKPDEFDFDDEDYIEMDEKDFFRELEEDEDFEALDQIDDLSAMSPAEREVIKKIDDYLDSIPVTKEEFSLLSDEEQDKIIEEYLFTPELFDLERELERVSLQEGDEQVAAALPAVIVAVGAGVIARVAIRLIIRQGAAAASKYLKKRLKNVGKNYEVKWNVTSKTGHQVNSLVVVFQKTKKGKKRVFAIDKGTIPLKGLTGKRPRVWHYHHYPDVALHRTLCSLLPKGAKTIPNGKPDRRSVCY